MPPSDPHHVDPILDPDDVRALQREGTLLIEPDTGFYYLHKRRLNRFSDHEYADLPLPTLPLPPSSDSSSTYITSTRIASGSSANLSTTPDTPARTATSSTAPNLANAPNLDHYSKIPQFHISRQTLIYIGFTEPRAAEIWARWTNWGDDDGRQIDGGPVTFLSMATAPIQTYRPEECGEDDARWFEAMEGMGVSEEIMEAIMAPAFKELRLSQSCNDWVKDTFEGRYEGLRTMQSMSRERAKMAREAVEWSRPAERR